MLDFDIYQVERLFYLCVDTDETTDVWLFLNLKVTKFDQLEKINK